MRWINQVCGREHLWQACRPNFVLRIKPSGDGQKKKKEKQFTKPEHLHQILNYLDKQGDGEPEIPGERLARHPTRKIKFTERSILPENTNATAWYVEFNGPYDNYNPKHGRRPHVVIQKGHRIPEVGKIYELVALRKIGGAYAWMIDGLGVDKKSNRPHMTLYYIHGKQDDKKLTDFFIEDDDFDHDEIKVVMREVFTTLPKKPKTRLVNKTLGNGAEIPATPSASSGLEVINGYVKTCNVINYTGNGTKKKSRPPPGPPPPKPPPKVASIPGGASSGSGTAGVMAKMIPSRSPTPNVCLWPEFKDGALPIRRLKEGALVDGIHYKAPPLSPRMRSEDKMSTCVLHHGLQLISEYVAQPTRAEMIQECNESRTNSSKQLAEGRERFYEQDRLDIIEKIINFVAKFYASVSACKRIKDHRFSWVEIANEVKMIVIKMLTRSRDVRTMDNGIAAQSR